MGGMRGSSHKRVPVALKLPQLQNLVKRDRDGYRDEFLQQHRNYLSELEIFKIKPSKDSDRFAELVTFMSHVAPCYKSETAEFGPQLKSLLEQHGPVLHPSIRMKLAQALMLLRNRGVLNPTELLSLFFGLFQCQDKALRVLLYDHIVNDIKNINDKGRNPRLNKSIQSVVYGMLKDDSEIAAKKSLDIMVHLYRKRIWVDARTVNVIASALVAETPRLACTALNFFLNIDAQMADDDEEEDKLEATQSEVNMHAHSKKTAKRIRGVNKSVKMNSKKARAGHSVDGKGGNGGLFPAINLLHDPQGTAEKVFRRLRQSKQRFEVKLLMMNFISRMIGAHRLLLLSFYSHLQRYVASQQREVTHILAYMVQACHDLVPPDEVMPAIKAVAYNFVTERCPGEVMALGINTIREICKRVPALLEEEGMDFLVQDLAAYSKHRDKSVVVAARSFINFIREVYPSLLKTRDRGKDHDITARPAKYGVQKLMEGVDGAELLTLHEQGLLPLGDDGTEEGEGDDLEEEDDEEEAPQLVELPGVGGGQGLDAEDDVEGGTCIENDEEQDEGGVDEMEVGDEENEGSEGSGMEEEDMGEDVGEGVEGKDDAGRQGGGEKDGMEKTEKKRESGEEGQGVVGMEGKATKRARRSKNSIRLARDVKGSDDPDADAAVEEAPTSKVQVPAHLRVDGTRILSAEDFEKIKQLKQQAADAAHDRKLGRKRKPSGGGDVDDDGEDSDEGGDGGESFAVEPRQLQGYRKRRRATLEERLESVIRGREKFQTQTHAGGLTNLEKERKKNFLMIRKGKNSVKRKTRLGDKQAMALKRKGVKVQMKRDKRKKRRT